MELLVVALVPNVLIDSVSSALSACFDPVYHVCTHVTLEFGMG